MIIMPSIHSNKRRLSKRQLVEMLQTSVEEVHLSCACSSSAVDVVLSRDNRAVRELCRVLDAIMCLGLISECDIYWPAVRELLPKIESDELIKFWDPKSLRAFSLSWLYHSLNNNTLEWQLLSFIHNKEVLVKYYNRTAFVLDNEHLGKVCEYLNILDGFPFSLKPPDQGIKTVRFAHSITVEQNNTKRRHSLPLHVSDVTSSDVPVARPSNYKDSEVKVEDLPNSFSPSPKLFGAKLADYHPERGQDALNVAAQLATSMPNGRAVRLVKNKNIKRDRTGSEPIAVRTRTNSDFGPRVSTPKEPLTIDEIDLDTKFNSVLFYGMVRESPDGLENPLYVPETMIEPKPLLVDVGVQQTADIDEKVETKTVPVESSIITNRLDNNDIKNYANDDEKLKETKFGSSQEFRVALEESLRDLSIRFDNVSAVQDNGENYDDRFISPDYQEGQVLLESGQIVQLAMQIFEKEGEQFYKMFRVFLNHNTGNPVMRWLMLTNHALYLLLKWTGSKTDLYQSNKFENPNFAHKYQKDRVVLLPSIDYLSIGINSQLITIVSKDRSSFIICTGSEFQTRSIISCLEVAVRRYFPQDSVPAVITDATPQRLSIQKWVSQELQKAKETCTPVCYFLVYWKLVATDNNNKHGLSALAKIGYIYVRVFYPNSWFKRHAEWRSKYFYLKGRKLYQFADSSCRVGEKILDLRHDVIGCREMEGLENALELILPSEQYTMQLSFQTKHEADQWLQAFVLGLSQGDDEETTEECLACFLTLTGDYFILGQEVSGFIRTLAVLNFNNISSVTATRTDDHQAIAMQIGSGSQEYADTIWWLSFRSRHELEKLIDIMKEKLGLPVQLATAELTNDSYGNSTNSLKIMEMCHEMNDFWRSCKQI